MRKTMDEQNVFQYGVEYFKNAIESLSELATLKGNKEDLKAAEKQLSKQVSAEEKSIQDEVNSTLKERKAEITSTYDKEIDHNRNKLKKAQNEKNKTKSRKVDARIEEETADLKEDNRQLYTEMKTLFKQYHVPRFCNSTLYYSLFMPKGFTEIIIFMISLVVALFVLPVGVCFLGSVTFLEKSKNQMLFFGLIFCGIVVLFFLLYFLIMNVTKVRHRDTLIAGRQIRDKIKANKKQIKATKNTITKDKDESIYGLYSYDEKISGLKAQGEDIAKDKQDALTVFENETKDLIIQEIHGRRLDKLKELKGNLKQIKEEIAKVEGEIQDMTLAITNQYEAYLGKQYMKEEVLNEFIQLMETENIKTVGEAIKVYKESYENSR